MVLAYLLTWTTYGTRVHGDARGSVDKQHNQVGTPFLPADPDREAANRARSTNPPFVMNDAMRQCVHETIRAHAGIRAWHILALNVRTNHVHIVLNCREQHTPEQAMQQLKMWCSRRLCDAGLVERSTDLWTRHGSTRYIKTEESLASAIFYVEQGQ
jgi:REP element-mobilizing transposase RayT